MRLFFTLILCCISINAHALKFVKDAETESLIKEIAEPILKIAGLNSKNINIHLINDRDINAFVTDSDNIFIYLGLISETDGPEDIIGVLAHEIAHIANNHIMKREEEIRIALKNSIITGIITGIAATVATSDGRGAIGGMVGSQHLLHSRLSLYSKMQEHAADKTAVIFMQKLGIPTSGLINTLKIIKNNTIDDPAMGSYRTHPLVKERIQYLAQYNIPKSNRLLNSPEFIQKYNLVATKIRSYIWPLSDVIRIYKTDDYAKMIVLYRQHKISESLQSALTLIVKYPQYPYFYEFKGQILLKNGRIAEAIECYDQALNMQKNSDLLKIELISALIKSANRSDWIRAEALLNDIENKAKDPFLMERSGFIKAKLGRHAESYIDLANTAMLLHDKERAVHFLQLAKKQLDANKIQKIIANTAEDIELM